MLCEFTGSLCARSACAMATGGRSYFSLVVARGGNHFFPIPNRSQKQLTNSIPWSVAPTSWPISNQTKRNRLRNVNQLMLQRPQRTANYSRGKLACSSSRNEPAMVIGFNFELFTFRLVRMRVRRNNKITKRNLSGKLSVRAKNSIGSFWLALASRKRN